VNASSDWVILIGLRDWVFLIGSRDWFKMDWVILNRYATGSS